MVVHCAHCTQPYTVYIVWCMDSRYRYDVPYILACHAMMGTHTIFEYDYSNEVRTTALIYTFKHAHTRTAHVHVQIVCFLVFFFSVSYCAYFVVAVGSFNRCCGTIRRYFQTDVVSMWNFCQPYPGHMIQIMRACVVCVWMHKRSTFGQAIVRRLLFSGFIVRSLFGAIGLCAAENDASKFSKFKYVLGECLQGNRCWPNRSSPRTTRRVSILRKTVQRNSQLLQLFGVPLPFQSQGNGRQFTRLWIGSRPTSALMLTISLAVRFRSPNGAFRLWIQLLTFQSRSNIQCTIDHAFCTCTLLHLFHIHVDSCR